MRIAIIAISARIYCQLASQAGHQVFAIDAFADLDTLAHAHRTWQLPSLSALDATALTALLQQLAAFAPDVVLVGAWFEHQISAYQALSEKFRVAGVAPHAIDRLKSPDKFTRLCQTAKIATPAIRWQAPDDAHAWLKKPVAGAGGQGVMAASDFFLQTKAHNSAQSTQHYYQAKLNGPVLGILVLVSCRDFLIVGIHRLHTCEGSYQYAGATTLLDNPFCARLQALCGALLSQQTGLLGLVSLDVIMDHDTPYLIDINPRLSASMRLYDDWPLIDMHLDVCLHEGSAQAWANGTPQPCNKVASHRIAYSRAALTNLSLSIPSWVEDQPSVTTQAEKQPFFSLFSRGATQAIVQQQLQQQKHQLRQQWGTYVCDHIAFNID